MGVAGSGKSTLGSALAEALGWPFFDGDDFHSQANRDKMAAGQPLDDADRAPWLARLRQLIAEHLAQGESLVLACSALKQAYRQTLAAGDPAVRFVYLQGDFDTLLSRLQQRQGHYMKAEMLRSQFAALEEPQDAIDLDVTLSVDEMVRHVRAVLEV